MDSQLANTASTLFGIVAAVLGAFLFAFWIAMGIWTFNDIRSRTHDWLAIALACLLVLIFPIVGLVLYSMIRPKETLAEVYDRALEEEALLRELEETAACYACGVPAKDDWVFCPNCHAQLQHNCPNCSRLARQEWDICVYCGQAQTAEAETLRAPREVELGIYDNGYDQGRVPLPQETLPYRPPAQQHEPEADYTAEPYPSEYTPLRNS